MSLLPFWARQAARAHVASASNPYNRVQQEPTFSIVISMACRISSISSTLTCSSSGGLRAASRLQSGQSLLPFSSRASCFWARPDRTGRRQALLTPKNSTKNRLQRASAFSTSVRRNAQREDEKGATSHGLPEHKKEVGRLPPSVLLRSPLSTPPLMEL